MSDDSLFSLELKISKFLRYGVLVAGAFMLIGWLSHLQLQGNPLEAFKIYQPVSLTQTLKQLWALQDWGVLTAYFGLFILISLPMLRVLMTAVLFIKQNEYILAAIAAFVLIALCLSFFLGFEI